LTVTCTWHSLDVYTMKYLPLLLIAFAIIQTSCSKPSKKLEGRWELEGDNDYVFIITDKTITYQWRGKSYSPVYTYSDYQSEESYIKLQVEREGETKFWKFELLNDDLFKYKGREFKRVRTLQPADQDSGQVIVAQLSNLNARLEKAEAQLRKLQVESQQYWTGGMTRHNSAKEILPEFSRTLANLQKQKENSNLTHKQLKMLESRISSIQKEMQKAQDVIDYYDIKIKEYEVCLNEITDIKNNIASITLNHPELRSETVIVK